MTNLEITVAALLFHREARKWDDGAVAADLMAKLGLDPDAVPAHMTEPVPGITYEHLHEAEGFAQKAIEAYHELVAKFAMQPRTAEQTPVDPGALLPNAAAQAELNPFAEQVQQTGVTEPHVGTGNSGPLWVAEDFKPMDARLPAADPIPVQPAADVVGVGPSFQREAAGAPVGLPKPADQHTG